MLTKIALLIAAVFTPAAMAADSTVLAAFLVNRHGDRTAKALGNTLLTPLGTEQEFQQGQMIQSRYLTSTSPNKIQGFNSKYTATQVNASAPNENVLGNSAQAFMQGLFSPDGQLTSTTLANGTTTESPLDGYQYVLISGAGATAESQIWIRGDTNCPA